MKNRIMFLAVNKANITRFVNKSNNNLVAGNLALNPKTNNAKSEYTQPKILVFKPQKTKKHNKIFCGCWQVANQEDAC